jgi:quinoprotein relay system zinc metallohydrolase 2
MSTVGAARMKTIYQSLREALSIGNQCRADASTSQQCRGPASTRLATSKAFGVRRAAITAGMGALLLLVLSDTARLEPAADGALPVQEIADGIFVYQAPYALAAPGNAGAVGNAGFIVGQEAVAIIDTTGSYVSGKRLLKAVRTRTSLPIRYVINTHVHPDHVLGNAAFATGETLFVAHKNFSEALTARHERYLAAWKDLIGAEAFAGTRVVLPTLVVADKRQLEIGSRPLIVEAWPTSHSNTDVTVFDQTTGTFFLGDLLFAGHVPALDGSLRGWLDTVEQLKSRKAARAVPGHGPASMPWPAALAPMENYLKSLQAEVRSMVRSGEKMQDTAARAGTSQRMGWSLFDDFNPRNAVAAYHEIEWE